ncbi:hypothetical protein FACS18942_05230 [Planctomycetales bacterium]|nr:hypothetical protein FACS18942_05230 [Planctomycetales bacterium]
MKKILPLIVLFVIFAGTSLYAKDGAVNKPNFLVVLSDDHSAPFVGAYGDKNATTPNLDKFASEGILFRRAYVSCPQCVPSRAGILASRSPVGIGMSRFSAAFPAGVKSYPEYLRENGYYTGLAGRTYHQEGYNGKGFPQRNESGELEYTRFGDRFDDAKSGPPLPQLAGFLDNAPKDKPFFLQLCFSDPHRPYDGQNIPIPLDPAKLILPSWFPDTPELRKDLAAYYDEINRFDRDFGLVLEELEKRGFKNNTVIIFLGDNGGAMLRGKGTLYEFGINVPFIVRWGSNIKAGTVSSALISAEDIGPTLLNIAGITPPKEFTGKTFLPILQSGKDMPQRKYVFAERGPHGDSTATTASFDLGRTIIADRYKLIYNALWQLPYSPIDFAGQPFWAEVQEAAKNPAAFARGVPESLVPYFIGQPRKEIELYDLQEDPQELNNLAGKPEYAAIEKELRKDLAEWQILEKDFIPLVFREPKQQNRNRKERNNNIIPDKEPGVKLLFDFTEEKKDITDISGKNNVVYTEGAVKYITKDGTSGRYFDGVSYIDIERSPALHCAETPWSVEAAVISDKPDGVILAYGGSGNGYSLFLQEGKAGFAVRTGSQVFIVLSNSPIDKRAVLKGVITPDKKAELYVNGQLAGTKTLPDFITNNPVEGLQIGTDDGGTVSGLQLPLFKGIIEKVEIRREL